MLYRPLCAAAIGVVAFLSLVPASQASLIGDTVDVSYAYPDVGSVFGPDSVVVGAGSEISCPGLSPICSALTPTPLTIDLGDFTIRFDLITTSVNFVDFPFNGLVFESLDLGGPISGVLLQTNLAGLDASRILFGADFLSINFAGTNTLADPTAQPFVELTLIVATEVPEPASLAIFGAGLAALGLLRRRKKSA